MLAAVSQRHVAQEDGGLLLPVDPLAEYLARRRGRVVERAVLLFGQLQCAVERAVGETVAFFRLPNPRAHRFPPLRSPEPAPLLQPPLLFGAVHHERCDAGMGVDFSGLFERIEPPAHAQVARDGFARRVGRGDEEHLRPFAVFVGQPAQPLLRGGQPGRVVVQVHHVAVKADAVEEEETYEREQQDRRHQRAVPVGTHSREPLHPFQHGGPPPAFLLTDQVGKQHQTEKRRSDQRQRCEQSEVAQQLRIGEEQSREGADGRYAADGQRIGQIADDLPRVVAVVRMAEYVDRIAQRDAHYDGPRTYGDRRNRMTRQRHDRQREQRAERHGNQGQQDRELVAEREGDERHDDKDGDVERQHHVALDLAGVVGRHGGSAVIVRRDSCGGVFGVQPLQRRLDPLDQPVADARVAALVVR